MNLPSILAALVIFVAVPLIWFVEWRLWRRSVQRPDLELMRERAWREAHLGVIVTIFALVFLNNGMEVPILDPFTTMVLTRTAILSLAVPALYWLWVYRT